MRLPDLYRDQAACSPASRAGARIVTEPPAFSTAAIAGLEAPQTDRAILDLSSPNPRIRTPSSCRLRTPALTRAAPSMSAAGSSLPASIAAWIRPRLTSFSLRANGEFLNPRLGSRRCSGIWPPSKPLMRTPERAVCPLPPRPPVLPVPDPMPRPMRARFLRAPGRSEISWSFIIAVLVWPSSQRPSFCHAAAWPAHEGLQRVRTLIITDHTHEVLDLGDHAANLRRVS